jgi:hypothetical protein
MEKKVVIEVKFTDEEVEEALTNHLMKDASMRCPDHADYEVHAIYNEDDEDEFVGYGATVSWDEEV